MVTYPVRVPRDGYRGRNEPRRENASAYNHVAETLEHYINQEVAESGERECYGFCYHAIARNTGIDRDLVYWMLSRVGCGHRGITVWKPTELKT